MFVDPFSVPPISCSGGEVAAVVVRRPLEHQVLEQVREPGAAGPLVLGPDVVPQVDRDEGAAVILVHDHVEPVVERFLLVVDPHGSHSPTSWMTSSRVRARVSHSTSTSCCQVPSASSASLKGIARDGPSSAARTWLDPLSSPHRS